MNAVSGENLSRLFLRIKSTQGVKQDTGGALGDVTDEAQFCRTTATCIRGVSDPLFSSAEPRQEGGRGGRSRPDVPSLRPTVALIVTRAAQSAAR